MPIIQVPARRPPKRRAAKRFRRFAILVSTFFITAGIINYARPLPLATTKLTPVALPAAVMPPLDWPAGIQAAVGADGFDVLATSGNQIPIATASIAKVITALCVLQKQPLASGQSGPTYTIAASDVAIYNDYVSKDGSNLPVALGTQITEYQALEALMIPSANNIADSLVLWVFGSQANYAAYATQYLTAHGLVHTHIGADASGFDPSTTSTANDLVRLGLVAQQNPVLMAIAGERSTTLPVAGTVYNYDTVLGVNGITGLKTGNSDQNPGAFLFTATATVGSRQLKTVGVVLGAPSLAQALHASSVLAGSLAQAFDDNTLLQKGRQIGTLTTKWGQSAPIVAIKSVRLLRWKGTPVREHHTVAAGTGTKDTTLGSLAVFAGNSEASTPLALQTPAAGPSFWWRLTRH